MREAMLTMPEEQRPDGFVYPSHRVKCYPALALADWAAAKLFADARVTIEQFVDSVICARFRGDPMRTSPPELDARQASVYASAIKAPALFVPAASGSSRRR